MNSMVKKLIIKQSATIKEAMCSIMHNRCGIIFITDNNDSFISVVTDGDIRRGILKGRQINENIMTIASNSPVFINEEMSQEQVINFLKNRDDFKGKAHYDGAFKLPVLNKKNKVSNILFVSLKDDGEYIVRCGIGDAKNIKKLHNAVRSVLVTGGAGYLGSVLCRKLLERKYRVTVLDNLMYGEEGIKKLYGDPNFKFINGDIRDLETVVEAIKGVDAVVHLAAIVGDPASTKFPQEAIDVNYLATKAIVEACKYYQVNRFIFASTCSVYGKGSPDDEKLTVRSKTDPVSLYAKMKLESEKAILSLADDNFSPIILRMATLYGLSPRMRFDLVINFFTAEAVIKKTINIFGGKQWRPFLHVHDAAEAYMKYLEFHFDKNKERIFNLGVDRDNYRLHAVARLIKKILPQTKINITKEKIDLRNYKVLFSETEKLLSFKSHYTLEKGIREIAECMHKGLFRDYKNLKYTNIVKNEITIGKRKNYYE